MASIRKRGDNYFIDYRVQGKRMRKHVGKSKEEAERILKDIKQQITQGQMILPQEEYSFNQLFLQFAAYCQANLAHRTQIRYQAIIDNFRRFLQKVIPQIKKVVQLTSHSFDQFKEFRLREGAAQRTINAEIIVLRMLFRLSIKWGYTKKNPLDDVGLIPIADKEVPRFLILQECRALLSQCDQWFYPILYTFFNTGMRKGELENLHWDDIDLTTRVIKIIPREGWVQKSFQREIPINRRLHDLLVKLNAQKNGSEYVFFSKKGEKIPENYLRKYFVALTRKCGFGDVTQIQSLRYTFGGELVKKGLDLATVRRLMGHSDKDTALLYEQFIQKRIDSVIEELDF